MKLETAIDLPLRTVSRFPPPSLIRLCFIVLILVLLGLGDAQPILRQGGRGAGHDACRHRLPLPEVSAGVSSRGFEKIGMMKHT